MEKGKCFGKIEGKVDVKMSFNFFSFQERKNHKNNSYLFLQKQLPNITFTIIKVIMEKIT